MQGFGLKRSGSGLKSPVQTARVLPPRKVVKMLRFYTECLLTASFSSRGLKWPSMGGHARSRHLISARNWAHELRIGFVTFLRYNIAQIFLLEFISRLGEIFSIQKEKDP